MTDDYLCSEIRDANLTYITLAQNLIDCDKADALLQLGVSDESADRIAALTPAQILKIASSNMLLCRFRVDDDLVLDLLTSHALRPVNKTAPLTTTLHTSHLMAARFAEAI